jgi:hydroxyacylglutathione hydrolase
MRLDIVKSKGLSHLSYYLSDGGEALVVDPRRDCSVYTKLAEDECSKIVYILETHRNEDYVVGSVELQNMTGAEIAHSRETPFGYGEYQIGEGDDFDVGRLRVKAIHTPGHTNDSLCFAAFDPWAGDEPFMVFTGDTLFAGGVGRTDLLGPRERRRQSERLYESLHERLLPLGNHVLVYPAHGSGSVCGSDLSDREVSSIGFEIKTNPLLGMEEEGFVEQLMSQRLLTPPYFRRMEEVNLRGAPLLREAPSPRPLDVKGFREEMSRTSSIVVDTREPGAFAGSHIPGSLSIWLDGLSHHPGWVLSHDERNFW